MLLRELKPGDHFLFADRKTPVALVTAKGQHLSTGKFEYVENCEGACPKLKHLDSGKEMIAVSNTYYRDVLIIF